MSAFGAVAAAVITATMTAIATAGMTAVTADGGGGPVAVTVATQAAGMAAVAAATRAAGMAEAVEVAIRPAGMAVADGVAIRLDGRAVEAVADSGSHPVEAVDTVAIVAAHRCGIAFTERHAANVSTVETIRPAARESGGPD